MSGETVRPGDSGSARGAPLFVGTRRTLTAGDEVPSSDGFTYCTPSLDGAIWAAELAEGDGEPRVYEVAASGPVEDAAESADYRPPPHPAMSWRARSPLVALREVVEWTHYHGTRADLRPGDLVEPGREANHGAAPRLANFVYFTRTLDAAIWAAELAVGDGPGRVYLVEPTGEFEDDPNLTNARFRGNPTKSFRSRAPLRVFGELEGWTGHSAEAVAAMQAELERLARAGVVPDD